MIVDAVTSEHEAEVFVCPSFNVICVLASCSYLCVSPQLMKTMRTMMKMRWRLEQQQEVALSRSTLHLQLLQDSQPIRSLLSHLLRLQVFSCQRRCLTDHQRLHPLWTLICALHPHQPTRPWPRLLLTLPLRCDITLCPGAAGKSDTLIGLNSDFTRVN